MNKYDAGLAPLAIVLILIAVVVVGGGGVYLATRSDTEVATSTTTPTATNSPTPSSTVTATPTKKPTPTPTKTAVVSAMLRFDTVQQAVSSGKNMTCPTVWWGEVGGPNQYRNRYFFSANGTIKIEHEQRVVGSVSISSTTTIHVPGDATYADVLKYPMATAICTQ